MYGTDRVPSTGVEAFYNEANTGFTSNGAPAQTSLAVGSAAANTFVGNAAALLGHTTAQAEDNPFQEMGFSIEKVTVTANTRALKAEYSMELAQDLKAVHGLS